MSGDDVYARVVPDPYIYDLHHSPPHEWWVKAHPGETYPVAIWPLARLSPSTHRRVHIALDAIVVAGGPDKVSPEDQRHHGLCWAAAVEAYNEALAAGLTPARTL